ncbi:MAG: hypothetical protein ABSG84_17495 [Acidobacteriaceae bacterium]|jgi:hypothetical protein
MARASAEIYRDWYSNADGSAPTQFLGSWWITPAAVLMYSQMPADMRTAIVAAISSYGNNPAARVRTAAYLIITNDSRLDRDFGKAPP